MDRSDGEFSTRETFRLNQSKKPRVRCFGRPRLGKLSIEKPPQPSQAAKVHVRGDDRALMLISFDKPRGMIRGGPSLRAGREFQTSRGGTRKSGRRRSSNYRPIFGRTVSEAPLDGFAEFVAVIERVARSRAACSLRTCGSD